METIEIVERLNVLLEAERAGVRILKPLAAQLEETEDQALLERVLRDEGRFCDGLAKQIQALGGLPSKAVGDFVQKVEATEGLIAKLELLNRGQAWVVRKIEELLPSVEDEPTRGFLKVMRQDHLANVTACEELVERLVEGPREV